MISKFLLHKKSIKKFIELFFVMCMYFTHGFSCKIKLTRLCWVFADLVSGHICNHSYFSDAGGIIEEQFNGVDIKKFNRFLSTKCLFLHFVTFTICFVMYSVEQLYLYNTWFLQMYYFLHQQYCCSCSFLYWLSE